jgi:hypothetical protein
MLGLQAASLEQQRELWNTQVRLQHTEILFRELDFYNTAFASLSTAAALLAGFAFSGLALALEEEADALRAALALLCVITTAINLVALCAATFAAIFSVRLALRGTQGEDNVEQAVRQAREEYKLVLRIFVAGIVFFFVSLGIASYLQLGPISATVGLVVSAVGLVVVGWLFSRIDTRFNLRRTARLTALSLRRVSERDMLPPASWSQPATWFGRPAVARGSASAPGSTLSTSYRGLVGEAAADDARSARDGSDTMSLRAPSEAGESKQWQHPAADELRGPLLAGHAGERGPGGSRGGARSATPPYHHRASQLPPHAPRAAIIASGRDESAAFYESESDRAGMGRSGHHEGCTIH